MPLTIDQIQQERENGFIIIEPFNENQLKNTMYDVRLGEWFIRTLPHSGELHNPWSKESKQWGEPEKAKVVETQEESERLHMPIGEKYFIIGPHETLLAHTMEFIGGRHHVTTKMFSKSSTVREGLTVCACGGLGDVGYFNIWTMEIWNHNDRPKILWVGKCIAQIVFEETAPIKEEDQYKGRYQLSDKLEELKSSWTPYQMLGKYSVSEDELKHIRSSL